MAERFFYSTDCTITLLKLSERSLSVLSAKWAYRWVMAASLCPRSFLPGESNSLDNCGMSGDRLPSFHFEDEIPCRVPWTTEDSGTCLRPLCFFYFNDAYLRAVLHVADTGKTESLWLGGISVNLVGLVDRVGLEATLPLFPLHQFLLWFIRQTSTCVHITQSI